MSSFIQSYPFALDIALGVVLLISYIIGAKRGLIKSLMGIAILGVALVGASWCSGHLTEPVTEWIQPKVTQYVVKKSTTKETAAVPQAAQSSVDLKSMDLSGIDLDNIDLNEVDLEGVDLGSIDLDGLDLNDLYKKFGGLFDGENGPSLSETLQNVQSSGQDLVTGMVTQLLTRIVHVALFVVAFLVLWLTDQINFCHLRFLPHLTSA